MDPIEIKTCRACPNALYDVKGLSGKIAETIAELDYETRLREKLWGKEIKKHLQTRISLSGCPNACSTPQVVDIGVIGRQKPLLDPSLCTGCGLCQEACPDATVKLDPLPVFSAHCAECGQCVRACPSGALESPAEKELLAGGRLGRRPHLARPYLRAGEDRPLLETLSKMLAGYLADDEERLADYLIRKVIGKS